MPSHNQILTLARSGNSGRAWALFDAQGLSEAAGDIKALTLKGRLLKDRGDRADASQRAEIYRQSAVAYLAAHALRADSYPLINAATLALLAGDQTQAEALATQVLALIEADPREGETAYWREATRAEALLLLGQPEQARRALAQGIAKLPRAWEDHAATIGQFERIITAQGGDAGWLGAYRPACSVHFSGLIGLDPADPDLHEQVSATIAKLKPGFAFGALAAGADILLAEAFVAAGATLHVTLPFARDEFRAISVEPSGGDWAERYDALLEKAETVDELWSAPEDTRSELPWLVANANLVSMGQCLRQAEVLRSTAHAITVAASGEPARAHLNHWARAGLPVHGIETGRVSGGPQRENGSYQAATDPIAMLAIAGAALVDLEGMAANHGLKIEGAEEQPYLGGPARDCLMAASEARELDSDVALSITVQDGSSDPSGQVALIANAADKGQCIADHQTAMIAKVLMPSMHVEEIGEVMSLSGPVGLFALDPA